MSASRGTSTSTSRSARRTVSVGLGQDDPGLTSRVVQEKSQPASYISCFLACGIFLVD
jgi:hypothetical protein